MSRLPDLERALRDAATRQAEAGTSCSQPAALVRRPWRRRPAPVLAAFATLLTAAEATAAVSGLLDDGAPVPASTDAFPARVGAAAGKVTILRIRAADPDGGPAWGLATFRVGTTGCLAAGRVQGHELGVVGRDHVFDDDGRFHPLPPSAPQNQFCTNGLLGGRVPVSRGGTPQPASGYTGGVTGPAGGCLVYRIKRATSSPQTRRRLRGKLRCDPAGLRTIKYGLADRGAVSVRIYNDRVDRTLQLDGTRAYIVVFRSSAAGKKPLQTQIAYRDGTTETNPARGNRPIPRVRSGHGSYELPPPGPVPPPSSGP